MTWPKHAPDLCQRCGEKPEPPFLTCEKCRTYVRERWRKKNRFKLDNWTPGDMGRAPVERQKR